MERECTTKLRACGRCGRCKDAFYCKQECQTEDWKTHKVSCKKKQDQGGAILYCTLPMRTTPYDFIFHMGSLIRQNLTLKKIAIAYFRDTENIYNRVITEEGSSAIRSTQIIMPSINFMNTNKGQIPSIFYPSDGSIPYATESTITVLKQQSKRGDRTCVEETEQVSI